MRRDFSKERCSPIMLGQAGGVSQESQAKKPVGNWTQTLRRDGNRNKSKEEKVGGWGKSTWCMAEEGEGKQKMNIKYNQMSGSGGVACNSFTESLV